MSPHLDDAVLSCATAISRCRAARVLTVYTGAPPVHRADGWNHATTGRSFAPDTQAIRRDEDATALARLGAEAHWLGRFEAEYRSGSDNADALTTALVAHLVRRAQSDEMPVVVAPLGLHHPDHIAVSDACLALAGSEQLELWLWRDLPYAGSMTGAEERRHTELRSRGIALGDPFDVEAERDLKAAAIADYASQTPALRIDFPSFDDDMGTTERFWPVAVRRS